MKPILNVELGNVTLKLQVDDLNSGIRQAVALLDTEVQNKAYPHLENLTADSMLKLREALPGLRITAHYLNLSDSRILDAH
jgi:hypothetical protein